MAIEWSGLSPELLVRLDRSASQPLRAQLEASLRDAIRGGRLRADDFYEQALPYIDGALGGTAQAYQRVCRDAHAVRRAHVTLSPDVVAGRVLELLQHRVGHPGGRHQRPARR